MSEISVQFVISLHLNDSDFSESVLGTLLHDLLHEYEPHLLDISREFLQNIELEAWKTDGASIGVTWPDYSPNTRRHSNKMLYETGRLRDSIGSKVEFTNNSVYVGLDDTACFYGPIHNQGSGRLPARIMIGILPSQIETLRAMLENYLMRELGLSALEISIEQV